MRLYILFFMILYIPAVRVDAWNQTICVDGLLLSAWRPVRDITKGERVFRGIVYFATLIYLFIGVSIISDRFMAAIEVITSTERKVLVNQPNGERRIMYTRVWNTTVSNLTLMALGSSAPEILLAIIEMFQKHFEAGELGPGTIIGSAAYNLFMITAICMVIIPKDEVRKITYLRVFVVTAAWSIIAYIWMYMILGVLSPGRIDIWEAILTMVGFPATVLTAYWTQTGKACCHYLPEHMRKRREGSGGRRSLSKKKDDMAAAYSSALQEYIDLLKSLRKQYPHYSIDHIAVLAEEQMIKNGFKSRAFYRIQATRKITGMGNLVRKIHERALVDVAEAQENTRLERLPIEDEDIEEVARIFFDPGTYIVLESCGKMEVRVVRRGDLSLFSTVEFETQNGTAEAGTDYVRKSGKLLFPPGVDEVRFSIEIIDDDVFEEDEHFFVRLFNASDNVILLTPFIATITILDDDHCGIFEFANSTETTTEFDNVHNVKVKRFSGGRGKVHISYWTQDGTATAGFDYVAKSGSLTFEPKQTEQFIAIEIRGEGSYENNLSFFVNLGKPQISHDDELYQRIRLIERLSADKITETERMILSGQPKLGQTERCEIVITESDDFKDTLEKLIQRPNQSLVVGTTTWREQFSDALTVKGGGTDSLTGEKVALPRWHDYVTHFLTLFWKIIFAFVPPTSICNGYLCFFVSLLVLALVTAVICDVAMHVGCTIGLKDAITAIVFVAIGTSLPDTFASKIAALNDKDADNSIGNVTGSNAINVFVGIGVAWTIAALYHGFKGNYFYVDAGSYGFSLVIYLILAFLALIILFYRRKDSIGGELGGPVKTKWICASIFLLFYVIYILFSCLEAYDVIKGF